MPKRSAKIKFLEASLANKAIPELWFSLEKEFKNEFIKRLQNREWKMLFKRHGDRFGLGYEELKAWGKWVVKRDRTGAAVTNEKVEKVEEFDPNQFLSSRRYWYDDKRDVYTTVLPGIPQPFEIPGAIHRDIIQAYSNWDGSPASINQIARTFGFPRSWIVKYLRVHEITHDVEPFSKEEVLERDEEELVTEALQLRRASLYRKYEKKKWSSVEKEAEKWREFELNTLSYIGEHLNGREKKDPAEKLVLKAADAPYAAVFGLSDFHWGKYSDAGENFEAFDKNIARQRLFECTQDALERLLKLGKPDKIYLPIGSDFLNVDNDKAETTRGTPQDNDGTPQEMLVSGCELMEELVDTLRQVAPVELVLMSGNHDRMMGLAILLVLRALYKGCPDVAVNSARTPRVYCTYGKNLIGFIHGDGVKKLNDIGALMSVEASESWHECPHRTAYTGHLHHEKTETHATYGLTKRQLPSLSGTDRWHARQGYVGAPKFLPIYVHDKERGVIAVVHGPAI